jgi:predicted ArsR family transcriptional regulator
MSPAGPGIEKLFDHWKTTVEEKILALLTGKESVEIGDLASRTGIPEEMVLIFIDEMVENKKVRIRTIGIH